MRQPDQERTSGIDRILDGQRQRIRKDRGRLIEGDPVLAEVGGGLSRIPRESHSRSVIHLQNSATRVSADKPRASATALQPRAHLEDPPGAGGLPPGPATPGPHRVDDVDRAVNDPASLSGLRPASAARLTARTSLGKRQSLRRWRAYGSAAGGPRRFADDVLAKDRLWRAAQRDALGTPRRDRSGAREARGDRRLAGAIVSPGDHRPVALQGERVVTASRDRHHPRETHRDCRLAAGVVSPPDHRAVALQGERVARAGRDRHSPSHERVISLRRRASIRAAPPPNGGLPRLGEACNAPDRRESGRRSSIVPSLSLVSDKEPTCTPSGPRSSSRPSSRRRLVGTRGLVSLRSGHGVARTVTIPR